jgi:signal peptidase
MRRRAGRALELAIGLALVAAWAIALRPTVLGGPATYVVVRGDSMLPGYQSGDLVLLEATPGYTPGDVVGYRVPDGEVGAGHVVVHRIIGGDGGIGFTVQGDNNPAPDPWLPHRADVVGRVSVLIPGLGRWVAFAHQPAVAGALAVSLLVMFVVARWPAVPGPSNERRHRAWDISGP